MSTEKYSALSGETLIEMWDELDFVSAQSPDPDEDEELKTSIAEVRAEISRRCRGGLSGLHALMGHLLENAEITYEDQML